MINNHVIHSADYCRQDQGHLIELRLYVPLGVDLVRMTPDLCYL
ncbi:hypothetical protein PT273_00510 [Orbaceae bacterium ESL0727]|nr:hypothetical protein [Orbaceae bacterium ESL0727]